VNAKLEKPPWLKVRLGRGPGYSRLKKIVRGGDLHTVCEEAMCPNMGRCWEQGRATLMILGDACTRNCRFCSVACRARGERDEDEPRRVAEAVKTMGLSDVVITSVTRDDLDDGGAGIWAETVRKVREAVQGVFVEVLVPDFGGSMEALDTVLETGPDVFGHNLETVRSLYPGVRRGADYERSLRVLGRGHEHGLITKTGIMVGLGETTQEVLDLMGDAAEAGCSILYVGQYLQPTKEHLPVDRYVEPSEFEMYREQGFGAGFKVVVSGPLVRSSYHSDEQEEYVRGGAESQC